MLTRITSTMCLVALRQLSVFAVVLLVFVVSACGNLVQTAGFSDVPYAFAGLSSVKARLDGTWLLEWETIPGVPVTYEIFSREVVDGDASSSAKMSTAISSKFDFNKPLAKTTKSFYISEYLLLKNNT